MLEFADITIKVIKAYLESFLSVFGEEAAIGLAVVLVVLGFLALVWMLFSKIFPMLQRLRRLTRTCLTSAPLGQIEVIA